MKNLLRTCVGILIVAMICFCICVWAIFQTAIKWPGKNADIVEITIEEGDTFSEVSKELKDSGLVSSRWLTNLTARLTGRQSELQIGSYEIKDGSSILSILRTLTTGSIFESSRITIPEGYTISQIGGLVQSEFEISEENWSSVVGTESSLISSFNVLKDKPTSVDLEGYLFPDTYEFSRGANSDDIAGEMISTLERRLEESGINLGDHDMHDVLTLASIIEREVQSEEDMALVADIFLKRLEIGMALQADSTVNYVTGKKTPAISLEDRDIDSPYNTYLYPGLPPGPISNPGIAAINAVLNPESNSYYYFLTDVEGTVYYSQTYEGHLQNKALHL